ncbi:MAG: HIT domain-containing protein [Alphaproteobacteria bacterium]
MPFKLHPQLAADTIPVGDLAVCRVLLMNNCLFPWLVLVPQREGLREIFDLGEEDYQAVMNEIRMVSAHFAAHAKAHKINIAALGNMVPQLHIHIIARFETDAAWPNPVWGTPAERYTQSEITKTIEFIKKWLCNTA